MIFSRVAFQVAIAAHLANVSAARHYLIHKQHRHRARKGTRLATTTIRRQRRSIESIHRELGPIYFRRAYRMSKKSFHILLTTIHAYLRASLLHPQETTNAPNGRIPLATHLAIAIRYFAGGEAYDLQTTFGVSHSQIFVSVDAVMDAVNSCPSISIDFPTCYDEQRKLARSFEACSAADISGCCGCIDGYLVWTHKPSENDCTYLGIGSSKFLCGRKLKFGLNLQAVCDSKLRFLDISILFGGATSDLLSFECSNLRHKLGTPGFLAPGLFLIGDNAYINQTFFATPYPNVRSAQDEIHKQKDTYNYYLSNLRVKIECAFGMLVNRWGFLRKKTPQKYSVQKTISAVSCLCRLHNFLINQTIADNTEDTTTIPPHTCEDDLSLRLGGAAPLTSYNNEGFLTAHQLRDAGHHQEDHDRRGMTQQANRVAQQVDITMPRETLCQMIADKDLRRPAVRRMAGRRS